MIFRLIMHLKCLVCSLWMAGLFVWMKQGRVFVPGEDSSQAEDSVDPGVAEVDEVIPEVRISVLYDNFKCFSNVFPFCGPGRRLWWRQELWREELW